MKKLLYILPGILFLTSCADAPKGDEQVAEAAPQTEMVAEAEEELVYPYMAGVEFDRTQAMSAEELKEVVKNFNGEKTEVSFTSEITENCEKKGCWMTVNGGDEEIRVSFKDYDFFVPLDSKGHQTTLNGVLFYDTLTVEQLRHYAMDANASEDSITNITEPIITLSYEATGVYVD